jgi:hypothetical protein
MVLRPTGSVRNIPPWSKDSRRHVQALLDIAWTYYQSRGALALVAVFAIYLTSPLTSGAQLSGISTLIEHDPRIWQSYQAFHQPGSITLCRTNSGGEYMKAGMKSVGGWSNACCIEALVLRAVSKYGS